MFYCGQIKVLNDQGERVYEGPSFVRCETYGCRKMVTNGHLEKHGACYCGGRKFRDAILLTEAEIEGLKEGRYELNEWERFFIWDCIAKSQEPV